MSVKGKILTDGWGEIIIYQLKDLLDYDIERLNKGILKKKSFDGGDFKNALIMRKYEKKSEYKIVHYNNWLDPLVCSVPKDKITIFESHGIHIGLGFKNSMRALEKPYKRIFGAPIHFLYFLYLKYKIKKFDVYLTSIPSALPYAKRVSSKAIWLPNAIDMKDFSRGISTLQLDSKKINIFLPSAIRILKNQRKAWEIIDNIYKNNKNISVYIIEHPLSNKNLVREYLDKYDEHIVWLPLIKREEITQYYKASWDLVLGNMCEDPTNAMLNMIELEAMACKAPIVAMDVFEIIKVPYEEIHQLAEKVISNKTFRESYIQRNYHYVKECHSVESVAKTYEKIIENIKK